MSSEYYDEHVFELSRADIGVQAVRRYGSGRIRYRAIYVRIGNLMVCSIDRTARRATIRMQSAKLGVSRVLGLPAIPASMPKAYLRSCHVLTVTLEHNSRS
jgi:hypothetical protein